MNLLKARHVALLVGLLTGSMVAEGKDIYVAASGGSDENSGSTPSAPLASIAAASSRAAAGDNVYLMSGQYHEAIVPVNSGTAAKPITYKSYGRGAAVISNVKIGILVSSQSYITFDGINVNGGNLPPKATVMSFAGIQNSNHITIRHGEFRNANGWAGIDISGRYLPDGRYWGVNPNAALEGVSAYITIEDNVLDNVGVYANPMTGDVIQVAIGVNQHILIQRNTITHGGHDLVELDSDYGVLQDNVLNNYYGDQVGGDTGYRSLEVQGSFNVIQRNFMAHSRVGDGIIAAIASIRGSQNLARQNILFDGISSGFGTWCASGRSPAATDGRIYNNTIYQTGGEGWYMWAYDGCTGIGGYVFANNLLVNSRTSLASTGVPRDGTLKDAELVLIPLAGDSSATGQSIVKGNLFAPAPGGPAYVITSRDGRIPLRTAASKYPQSFIANTEARPTLISAKPSVAADFQLSPGSPGRGAGVFLTNVVGSGTSNHLAVRDSLYFSDGNGVVPGDMIQLQGTAGPVQILSIERNSNTLTLSSPVTFKDGQGVALPYTGAVPDVGAGLVNPAAVRPMPPANVSIGH
ncbi:MAG TPA: hypothetical protein VI195_01920 [Steroidobacteraceae bacterium]